MVSSSSTVAVTLLLPPLWALVREATEVCESPDSSAAWFAVSDVFCFLFIGRQAVCLELVSRYLDHLDLRIIKRLSIGHLRMALNSVLSLGILPARRAGIRFDQLSMVLFYVAKQRVGTGEASSCALEPFTLEVFTFPGCFLCVRQAGRVLLSAFGVLRWQFRDVWLLLVWAALFIPSGCGHVTGRLLIGQSCTGHVFSLPPFCLITTSSRGNLNLLSLS